MIPIKEIIVNDKMQRNYTYVLSENVGDNFHIDFKPELSPKQLLEMGIFGGKYMTDCKDEFPLDWFSKAKLAPGKKDFKLNYFKIDASLDLSVWVDKGWIYKEDPRGWFQWYCRYYMGRRLSIEDERQVKRWKAMRRHIGAIKKFCTSLDLKCRIKQRQALLHWAYDSRTI
jgi:hypothetical protein